MFYATIDSSRWFRVEVSLPPTNKSGHCSATFFRYSVITRMLQARGSKQLVSRTGRRPRAPAPPAPRAATPRPRRPSPTPSATGPAPRPRSSARGTRTRKNAPRSSMETPPRKKTMRSDPRNPTVMPPRRMGIMASLGCRLTHEIYFRWVDFEEATLLNSSVARV